MDQTISLVRAGFPASPGMDIAVSRALLQRASAGAIGETFRLHVPGRVVAFGKRDAIATGYGPAVDTARSIGFGAVERLAGGRAAVFHEGTFAFSWTIPDRDPRSSIRQRFETVSELMVKAFRSVGVDSGVGEIEGEYCAGSYSVHHRGVIKLMGVGQRLTRHAAHVGGVVVVTDSALARSALVPVYRELKLEWEPSTVGSLQDVIAGITMHEVAMAIEQEVGKAAPVRVTDLDDETIALASQLAPDHVPSIV